MIPTNHLRLRLVDTPIQWHSDGSSSVTVKKERLQQWWSDFGNGPESLSPGEVLHYETIFIDGKPSNAMKAVCGEAEKGEWRDVEVVE